ARTLSIAQTCDRLFHTRQAPRWYADCLNQLPAYRAQLALALWRYFGIAHIQPLEGVQNDCRDDQARVFLVIGRHDEPGRMARAGSAEARFVSLHVLRPVLALFDVGERKLPVLVRIVDAREEALALLFLRQVQKKLDDARAVA